MHTHVWHEQWMGSLQEPWKWNQRRRKHRQQPHPLVFPSRQRLKSKLSNKWQRGCVALSKQGQRFFSSVATISAGGDTSASNRLIKKFVAASPKSVALDALSHLLSPNSAHSHLSSLAFPLYSLISETSWFNWNPKLVADLIPLLDRQGRHNQSASLISDSISKLECRKRDLALFYCHLIEAHSKHGSSHGFDDAYARLDQLVRDSNSVYVKRQGYKSMVSGLCEVGRPGEAEGLMAEMSGEGVKPSFFEFRCVLYGYGRLGLFDEMQKSLEKMQAEGFEVDTVCANMVLSSYGARSAHSKMVLWLQKMKNLGIPLSMRTWNSVLNSCPTIMSMLQNSDAYPTSIQELMKNLSEEEAMLVKELVGSPSVLNEAMKWDAVETKLDLHGMHLGSAYLMMLQWMEEMRSRFNEGKHQIPAEITVVCGLGNHSRSRGESPVKHMVREIMTLTGSPMRIDRKNTGCFVAKGKVVKEWLC